MVNNIKLKLLLPTEQTNKFKVIIDNDIKCISSAKCGNFEEMIFDISPGNHTLRISFAEEKASNKTGKLKFDLFIIMFVVLRKRLILQYIGMPNY